MGKLGILGALLGAVVWLNDPVSAQAEGPALRTRPANRALKWSPTRPTRNPAPAQDSVDELEASEAEADLPQDDADLPSVDEVVSRTSPPSKRVAGTAARARRWQDERTLEPVPDLSEGPDREVIDLGVVDEGFRFDERNYIPQEAAMPQEAAGPTMHGPDCSCPRCGWGLFGPWGQCYDWCWSQDLTGFAGPHGFKSPVDQGRNGNFGLHYGLNWGAPLWYALDLGFQAGANFAHSNFSGDQTVEVTDDTRSQYFVTAGLFRRTPWNRPFQYGVVVDYLRDNYVVDLDFVQLRAEFAFVTCRHNEIGFWGAFTSKEEAAETDRETENWEPMDQYNFFLRHRFSPTAEARLWGGFTGDSRGIFGGDFSVAMSERFGLNGSFNYINPQESAGLAGLSEESWSVNLNLVWYPGRTGMSALQSPWRPLFDVADNTSLILQRRAD